MEKKELSFSEELRRRFDSAWCPAFRGYFWGYIVFFAFLNIFFLFLFEKNFSTKIVATALATYFFGLIAASAIEINLSLSTKNKASFSIYSGFFYTIGSLLLLLTFKISSGWSLIPAILGFLLALLMWIIGNSDNPKLNDETYRDALDRSRERINNGTQDLIDKLNKDE